MPPKKKGNKKANDDWEAELGESADPVAAPAETTNQDDVGGGGGDDVDGMGGGLMAALRKNKSRKAKKGKPVQDDFVEGEDPTAADGINGDNLASKAPEEAAGDDLFAPIPAKGKGAKGKPGKVEEPADDASETGEPAGLKSKKEKEKEKKEREKQRKKEQVRERRDHTT